MSGLFKMQQPPQMQEAAKPVSVDETKIVDNERDRLARRRGRASTILAGDYNAASNGAAKTLLGQ